MGFAMSSLILLVLLSSLLVTSYSAVFLERQSTIPGHENLCYDKEDNIFYKKGEEMKWKSTGCGRKICKGSNGRESVYTEIQTCGKVHVPPECRVEVNLHLPYPKCCQRVICPDALERNIPDRFLSYNS